MLSKTFKQEIKLEQYLGKKVFFDLKLILTIISVVCGGLLYAKQYIEKHVKDPKDKIPALQEKKQAAMKALIEEKFHSDAKDLKAVYPYDDFYERSKKSFKKEIEELAKVHKSGIWLTKITINRKSKSIRLEGKAEDSYIIDDYHKTLQSTPTLSPYDLSYIKIDQDVLGGDKNKRRRRRRSKEDEKPEIKIYKFIISNQEVK